MQSTEDGPPGAGPARVAGHRERDTLQEVVAEAMLQEPQRRLGPGMQGVRVQRAVPKQRRGGSPVHPGTRISGGVLLPPVQLRAAATVLQVGQG